MLVTNPKRIRKAIEGKNATRFCSRSTNWLCDRKHRACLAAKKAGWAVMVLPQDGETEDTFIADLVVGLKTARLRQARPAGQRGLQNTTS
jgi:enolase